MGHKKERQGRGRGVRWPWRASRGEAPPATDAGTGPGDGSGADAPRPRVGWARTAVRAAGEPWRAVADGLRGAWAETRSDVLQERSWRRAVREAGDVGALRGAFGGLARTVPGLLRGPEPDPPPVPPSRWRLVRWVRRYQTALLWLVAFAMFSGNVAFLQNNSWLGDPDGLRWVLGHVDSWVGGVLIVPVSFLMVLPLGLASATPLRAWRVTVLVAALSPLVAPIRENAGPPWAPVLIFVAMYVTYALAIRLELSRLVGVWLVTSATILWSYLVAGRDDAASTANATIIFLTVLLALGYLVGTRRRLQREVVEREQQTQEEQARRALLEERARIARELHDVVAHHMSVIAVRAETAPFRIPDLSQAGKDDMAETSALAREALNEMRRLLNVLRGAGTGGERAPQPSLDRLEQLVAGVQRAGVTVDTRVLGRTRPLPQGVELSAYRIVQEALSNVLRHAPGAPTSVVIAYDPENLRVRVENQPAPGRGTHTPPSGGVGHGIIGMRERATMLGGTLETGPTPSGGFLVEAVLPLGGRKAEDGDDASDARDGDRPDGGDPQDQDPQDQEQERQSS